jgi:hypothetical protein
MIYYSCSRPSMATQRENERQFRFPFLSPGESRVLRAGAVIDRPGIVPTPRKGCGSFYVLNRAATPGNAPGRADNHGAWIPAGSLLKPARLKMAGRPFDVTTPPAGCHAGVTARGVWLVASEPRDTMKTPNPSEVEQTIPGAQRTCSMGLLCSTDPHRAEQSIP